MRRPRLGLDTEEKVFRYYMPDDPPGPDQCWIWQGSVGSKGYGLMWLDYREVRAHVAAQRIFNGPVRPGEEVLHSCDRPLCVNPHHLSSGTHAENMRQAAERGIAKGLVGTAHHQAKLSDVQVLEIIERKRAGEVQAALAREYGVSETTVSRIVLGSAWRHLQKRS
jgi:HNH endonuclease